ncbi:LytTR family transcriptional regulator DNA-binding domain-containing protein [Hyphobacterium sp. CCMP332]|nr:LytTR family transcriptional regulator DNA-binding domain-containing protein [Hyphobacterium sp. CCMP332]
MRILEFLYNPFPSPSQSKRKLFLILLIGVVCSLFILIYNPFDIADQSGRSFYVDFLIFLLGIIFSASVIFMDWLVPRIYPGLFKNWTVGKTLLWYVLVFLFTGMNIYFYKSFLGGFQQFEFNDFIMVLFRIVIISFTVIFFILGITQFLNLKKVSKIASGTDFEIKSKDDKSFIVNLRNLIYVKSDDNYVDIFFWSKEEGLKKRVFRSSLRNIENQIVRPFSTIKKCHRQYLINTIHFEIQNLSSKAMTLKDKKSKEIVPVSGRYVNTIRKAMAIRP